MKAPDRKHGLDIVDLHVTDCIDGGIPYIVSFWKPSQEELQKLAEGGSVAVWILGGVQPVLAIAADKEETSDA